MGQDKTMADGSDQIEAIESQNQYNALLQSHVLGIEDPFINNMYGDDDENSPGLTGSSQMTIMRSNEKPPSFKKMAFHRPFSSLDNVILPIKSHRKIAKTPYKVLDAPALKDDYYLNLLDWSSQNVLAVGLASNIYLWSATTSRVTKLADLGPENSVASIQWSKRGS